MFETLAELLAAEGTLALLAGAVVVTTVTIIGTQVLCKQAKAKPVLLAALQSLSLNTTVKVSEDGALVVAPHWESGVPGARPAVFHLGELNNATLQATILITESLEQPATGKLAGQLGGLQFECDNCPLTLGPHPVTVRLTGLPESIQCISGSPTWSLTSPVSTCNPGSTVLELFVILAPPGPAFANATVWVEALRFLCGKDGVAGATTAAMAAKAITRYCHGQHGLEYNSVNHYTYAGIGHRFCLDAYIQCSDPKANCYDQAGAVQVLCNAVGALALYKYSKRYGYITPTNLMGVANCNNPGYRARGTAPVVAADSPDRTGFCDHAFCMLDGMVYDACVGPQLGTLTLPQYLGQAIDRSDVADELLASNNVKKGSEGPTENAVEDDVGKADGVTILDRGKNGQAPRRLLNSAIVDQKVLSGVLSTYKAHTNNGASHDVTPVEAQIEKLLENEDLSSSQQIQAALHGLGADMMGEMMLGSLNEKYKTKVTSKEISEASSALEQKEEEKSSASDDAAWTAQLEERQMCTEMLGETEEDFDARKRGLGYKVYPATRG